MADACIVGVGASDIGQRPGVSAVSLQEEAVRAALADAGIESRDVDGLIVRGPDDIYTFHQVVGRRLGIRPAFSTTLSNGGASQVMGIMLAEMAIRQGLATTVVCGYARDGWSRTRGRSASGGERTESRVALVPTHMQARQFGPEYGFFGATAMHAMGARRHMHVYGTDRESFGRIAVEFRSHASRNPRAQRQRPLSLGDYFDGRPVVDPFNVHDCSLLTDGAGAAVVTSAARAADSRHRPVRVLGGGWHTNSTGWLEDEHMVKTAAVRSGAMAYQRAGVGPDDIDLLQLYDCFTYMVLVQLEDYGFCDKGEGAAYVKHGGVLSLGSKLPVNTSGGQLSEGHVEGMLQIVEAVRQLRHEYGPDRQVAGAELALVSGHGGNTVSHSTTILARG